MEAKRNLNTNSHATVNGGNGRNGRNGHNGGYAGNGHGNGNGKLPPPVKVMSGADIAYADRTPGQRTAIGALMRLDLVRVTELTVPQCGLLTHSNQGRIYQALHLPVATLFEVADGLRELNEALKSERPSRLEMAYLSASAAERALSVLPSAPVAFGTR